jgi:hypothetical protein
MINNDSLIFVIDEELFRITGEDGTEAAAYGGRSFLCKGETETALEYESAILCGNQLFLHELKPEKIGENLAYCFYRDNSYDASIYFVEDSHVMRFPCNGAPKVREGVDNVFFMSEKDIKEGGELKNQYRWFDFHPSFFAQKQGNMFMVKNKFLWDEKGGPLIYNDQEHLDVGYTFNDNNSFSGKILISYSRAVLYNVIKNSFQQKHEFEPLPPIEELILPPDRELHEPYRQFFEQMKENGKNFRNETFLYAVSQRKRPPENLWHYRILTTGYQK